tara:strand:- start:619 stop:1029 length:411 start_codon:yes stop_codon:yes gene_type:complete
MIYITVSGKIKNKKQFEDYAHDCMHWLIPNIRRDVDVWVQFKNKVEHGHLGMAYGDKHGAVIEIAKTQNGKELLQFEIAKTLAHELVHAKQFIKGHLHPSLDKWKNVLVEGNVYKRSPWEKEAFLLEDELYDNFWK